MNPSELQVVTTYLSTSPNHKEFLEATLPILVNETARTGLCQLQLGVLLLGIICALVVIAVWTAKKAKDSYYEEPLQLLVVIASAGSLFLIVGALVNIFQGALIYAAPLTHTLNTFIK